MKHARADYDRIQDPDHKIPDDEPVFLLRGQDPSAPSTLRYWARRNMAESGSRRLSIAALNQARRMELWQKNRQVKPSDVPATVEVL